MSGTVRFRALRAGDSGSRSMDELKRVTFRFADTTQVHYLADVPKQGEAVAHGHDLWVVSRVESDEVGTLVVCEPSRPAVAGDGE
jgi:hypothetical protein